MFKRSLTALAVTGALVSTGLALSPAAHAATAPKPDYYTGYLVSAPTSLTAPTTLSYQTRYKGLLTVNVSTSTQIVRRYNGASELDELSANDQLQVWGKLTGTTLVATRIKDTSIQDAWTRFVGRVLTVSPSSVSVIDLHNVRHDPRKDKMMKDGHWVFGPGAHLTLPIGASTVVISGTTTMTGTSSLISVGQRIVALGTVNRNTHNFTETARVRILK